MSDTVSSPNSQDFSPSAQEAALVLASEMGEQFLQLSLPKMTVLLPVCQLTEVLTIPVGQIVPMPHMPPYVIGVFNWRGEILWMVDLGHLCGLTPWYEQSTYGSTHSAVVLQLRRRQSTSPAQKATSAKSQTLGLVVNKVGDIEQCNPDAIQSLPSSTSTPKLAPLLRGYWWKPEGDMFAVLDGEAIIGAMSSPEYLAWSI